MAINLFPNSSHSQRGYSKVEGSYRAQFKSDRIQTTTYEPDTLYSTNILMQPEYKNSVLILIIQSLMQIRLEDYYLIRSQQISDAHKEQVKRAARINNFNTKLITQNNENLRPPNFGTKSSDIFKNQQQSRSPNNQNLFPQSNNIFQQPANNQQNIFQQPTNNLFPQSTTNKFQQPTNNQPNIFQQPTNNQPNIFQQPSNNIFQQPSNNLFQQPSNNLFQQPSNNLFQQPSNNLFQQQQTNQQPTNYTQQLNLFQQPTNQNNLFQQQPNLFQQSSNSINLFSKSQQQPLNFQNSILQNPIGQMSVYSQPITQSQIQSQSLYFSQVNSIQNDLLQPLQYFITSMENCSKAIDSQLQQQNTFSTEMEEILNKSKRDLQYERTLTSFASNEREKLRNERTYPKPNIKTMSSALNKTVNVPHKKTPISEFNDGFGQSQQKPSCDRGLINNQQKSSCMRGQNKQKSSCEKRQMEIQKILCFEEHPIKSFQNMEPQLTIQIKFLESDRELQMILNIDKITTINKVKQNVENHLDNCDIFGCQQQEYFNNCQIFDEKQKLQQLNQIIKEQKALIFRYSIRDAPKLTKKGYTWNVNKDTNYSEVKDFRIQNEFVSLEWPNSSNIRHIDLDQVVEIEQGRVQVYDKNKMHNLLIPEIGHKLNKECKMTFKLKQTLEITPQFEEKIKKQAKDQDLEFIEFDKNERTYTVKAKHFSSYEF